MLTRRAFALGAALVLTAACGKRAATITIEQPEIQQRVSALFPIQRDVLLARVTLQNPVVILREGSDRIGVDLDVRVALPLLPEQTGKLGASGKLAYRPAEKAFYLEVPTVDRLEIAGVPPEHAAQLRGAAEAVVRLVLASQPVYQLAQRDYKEVAAEHVLENVSVRNGKVVAELGLPGGR